MILQRLAPAWPANRPRNLDYISAARARLLKPKRLQRRKVHKPRISFPVHACLLEAVSPVERNAVLIVIAQGDVGILGCVLVAQTERHVGS